MDSNCLQLKTPAFHARRDNIPMNPQITSAKHLFLKEKMIKKANLHLSNKLIPNFKQSLSNLRKSLNPVRKLAVILTYSIKPQRS